MVSQRSRNESRRRRAVSGALAVGVPVLVGGAYTAASALGVAAPHVMARWLLTPPSRRAKVFPRRDIAASTQPRPFPVADAELPETVPWRGTRVSVEEFLRLTHTNCFVVIRDGKMVREWYRDGFGPATPHWAYSVSKSLVSLLAGLAIEHGTLRESDLLVDVLPQLRSGTAYDTVTIADLLDMVSGIDVPENDSPWKPLTGTAHMTITTDLDRFLREHRELANPPGSTGEYRSIDTQLLATAVATAEGTSLSELLGTQIWEPAGAQDPAGWSLDRDGGREKAFIGVNATARDLAKIGQCVLDDGMVGDTRVLPETWIKRIRTPAPRPVEFAPGVSAPYSAQWWHLEGGTGEDFSAVGVHGQYIYIHPPTRTVIVKLSDHGLAQDEQETIDAFRALCTPVWP
ncbi:serine hydrolase [Nocardia otitidiscaviarum]|uniref:serine hydrolase domain-containing protein n=1 Tax=Nocardia otitidiscaviarum TaxID=1823 RepID=UPI0018942A34|nr:serine hydrolase [Nocardia otitidiscaviarum]MBF6238341.1 serine hydrolase [Nocardia otitidiscaviarum]